MNTYKYKILFVVIALVSCFQIFSQNHVYKHYDDEEGIPSLEVYSAFQDSKGYMWFATDAGVSRFNGYEFENFDISDGLTDNTVFVITEDHKGRIWFGTFNCKLSYYENDSIHPFKYNDKIVKAIKNKSAMLSLQIDKDENIWMGFLKNGIYKCEKDGKLIQMVDKPKSNGLNFKFIRVNDEFVFGNSMYYVQEKQTKKDEPYKISGEFQTNDTLRTRFNQKLDKRSLEFCVVPFQDNYLIHYNSRYFLKSNKTEETIKEVFLSRALKKKFFISPYLREVFL